MRRTTRTNWIAALVLGLCSSSFSTIVSQLAAGRIGRDALVDWMEVAAIPLRSAGMALEPTKGIVAAGIAFHQWADISWALVFFGVFGRLTARLSPAQLLLIAAPWALLTSFLEWSFLVPVFPFAQPTFTLRQPYWIGFFVHFASGTIYPFFPLIRDYVAARRLVWTPFLKLWGALAVLGPIALGVLAALPREPAHVGGDLAYDATYLEMMTAHHRQGMALAERAAAQAVDPLLRARARLMYASQAGEIAVMDRWRASWGATGASGHDHGDMPGMIPEDEMAQLSATKGEGFDVRFVTLMSRHHAGAIQMAQDALRDAGDPRVKIFSESIAHQQCGDIALMHGAAGWRAVGTALRSFWLSLIGGIEWRRDCAQP